jgi:PhnB protein
MANSNVKAIPQGMHSVTPHLVCAGAAEALEFYKKAFGAVEMFRMPAADGKIVHASFKIGDSMVMLADEFPNHGSFGPKALKGTPVVLHVYVEDADAFVKRAADAGAKITMPVTEMFWGDRYGQVEDPYGHRWAVATHIKDMTPDEIKKAMPKKMAEG